MAKVVKLKIDIRRKEVLRYLKFEPTSTRLNDEIETLIKEALELGKRKVKPRFAYQVSNILDNDGEKIRFKGFSIASKNVARMLRDSVKAIIFVTSIGPGLEKEIDRLFKKGEPTKAVILDAVGSEAVETLTDTLQERLAGVYNEFRATPRLSPGYGDWNLKANKGILKLLAAQKIGVKVSPSLMLIPQKTVTGVWGLSRGK